MSRFVISAVSVANHRVTRCRIHAIICGDSTKPEYEPRGRIAYADEVVNKVLAHIDQVWVLRWRDGAKLPPERVRVPQRADGVEALESCDADGNRTESLHQAPQLNDE